MTVELCLTLDANDAISATISGEEIPLQSAGLPLVAGVKHLPVTFTPTAPVGG